jgi:hypothetical protein
MHQVPLVLFDDGLKSAFCVYFMLINLVLLEKVLLRLAALIVQVLPDGFSRISGIESTSRGCSLEGGSLIGVLLSVGGVVGLAGSVEGSVIVIVSGGG